MKKVFVLLSFVSLNVSAQDVIVKKDGSTILSKVLEVNQNDIKYKKYSNQNGPTYTIGKSDIISINYENGDKDMFGEVENQPQTQKNKSSDKPTDPQCIKRNPSEDNEYLIGLYGKRYTIGKKFSKQSKASVSSCLTTWGVAPSSTVSNEDIEIEFLINNLDYFKYTIFITNRTDHTIYIDRGNSYRVSRDENFCYYNSGNQVTVTRGKSGGMTVNLGSIANVAGIGGALGTVANGVNVGGGVSNTSGMTIGQQRFLVLPPNGRAALAKENDIAGNKLDRYERLVYCMSHLRLPIHNGEVLNYDENNTPYAIDYLITYSDNQNFTTYSVLNTKLYLKQVFGTHLGHWSRGINDTMLDVIKRRINCVDEFGNYDRYCIMGYMGGEKIVASLLKQ